MIVSGNSSI